MADVANDSDEVGTWGAGNVADVLVVAGNPLEDLQILQAIRVVIRDGTVTRDETIDEL